MSLSRVPSVNLNRYRVLRSTIIILLTLLVLEESPCLVIRFSKVVFLSKDNPSV